MTSSLSLRAPVSAVTRCSPAVIAREGSSGVEGSLNICKPPPASKTKSVKVPPVSTPILMVGLLIFLRVLIRKASRYDARHVAIRERGLASVRLWRSDSVNRTNRLTDLSDQLCSGAKPQNAEGVH